jgi:Flp pilus assembly protein TadB
MYSMDMAQKGRSVENPETASAPSVGELVSQGSEQLSRLVRQEIALARAEVSRKAKDAAIGGGLFGGAALILLFAVQALVVAGIAGLALVLPVWAAALVVAGVLLVVAGVAALSGKREVGRALPPAPTEAIESTKADIEMITERARS